MIYQEHVQKTRRKAQKMDQFVNQHQQIQNQGQQKLNHEIRQQNQNHISISNDNNHSHIYRIINHFYLDFNLLAKGHPKLYPHLVILNYRTVINFKNQQSLIVLAQAIMKLIFGITWSCPPQNLCPRIPNRLNYLLWINQYTPIKIQNAIDVGTGANLVYPLLGWALFKWKFVAIQTNQISVKHAKNLVKINNLQNVIKVIKGRTNSDIFNIKEQIERENREQDQNQQNKKQTQKKYQQPFDIVICNPPFYDNYTSQQEEQLSLTFKSQQQKKSSIKSSHCHKKQARCSRNVCQLPTGTMLKQQFSVEGGEYSFFFQIYRESFKYISKTSIKSDNIHEKQNSQISIRYFSCLLGRLTNFMEIKNFLSYQLKYGVLEMYRLGEIRQGSNARFIVMWRPKYPTTQ